MQKGLAIKMYISAQQFKSFVAMPSYLLNLKRGSPSSTENCVI